MSQKVEKPTLTGHRIKTRKRDEKEKYDATVFRDAILLGLNEAGSDFEQKAKYLDTAGSRLDYRRYAEPLFDVLFAGGLLAPGGTILLEGNDKVYEHCVFRANEDPASLQAHYEVLYKLIRRYKYLEKSLDEELKKLLLFLKGFNDTERQRLAQLVGICLGNGLCAPNCLVTLFEQHLVKDGLSIEFAQCMFRTWLSERDIQNVATSLKKLAIDTKLMELLPINKRTQENFDSYFSTKDLEPIREYQKLRQSSAMKRGVQSSLEDMIHNEEPVKEMISLVKEHMTKTNMPEHEMIVMVWNTLMNAVEWTKKEELLTDQVLKYLKQYSTLLAALTQSARAQLTLLVKMQEFCYDNMNFLKVFSRIVVLFYKSDVLGEDAVLKWYDDGHSAKGKTVFLEQTKSFVQWLKNTEEESDEEEEA